MYKKIVIKVGSSVITEEGRLDKNAVRQVVDQIVELKSRGVEAVLVTSGAVATGKGILGVLRLTQSIAERQVLASVGQVGLMTLYAKLFGEKGSQCAQILVTKGDFRDREHYANMKSCFENLLKRNVVPVVNENDGVAIHELGFSDNDELAALISTQLNSDAILFLSSVDGVLAEGKVISEIHSGDIASLNRFVTHEKSASGRGGMETKFKLAKKLMGQGVAVHITNGKRKNAILDIVDGKPIGTKFIPEGKLSAVKRRLAYADGLAVGSVYVNQGAEEVLLSKTFKSLLPVGIVRIEGVFKKGDTIEIRTESGKKIGSGIAQYGVEEARTLVGTKGAKALIHYDYLFIG